MPPKKTISSHSAAPSKSGRQRTLTNKQQQLLAQRNEKEGAAKQRALNDAIRSEQRIEEINGFYKRKQPELCPDDDEDDDLGPESEDNNEEPQSCFSSVTIPPIIKTVVRNGRTLVYRVQNSSMGNEITSSAQAQMHASAGGVSAPRKSKGLVRRVTGDSSTYPSMTPSQLPGHEEVELLSASDGEFQPSALATVTATQHRELADPFYHAHTAPETKQKEMAERKRKEAPETTTHETTVVTKSLKVEGSGSRGRVRTADFSELTRSIIEETISIYRAQIGSVEPFPERAGDRDTVKQAWLEVCRGRNLRVELEEDMFKFIVARASQARGYAKTISRPYSVSTYKIDGHGSKREIRDTVEQLLEGARFIYKDPTLKTGIFRAALIQTLINKIWFKNKEDEGIIHPEFSENDMLPVATLAFVLTLIENNLDEWVTGEHIDVPFTATAYKAKYRAHLNFITDFEKKTREADIIPRLLKYMLKLARKHAKVSGEGVPQASSISNDEIEAAKREWADLVLSDDE